MTLYVFDTDHLSLASYGHALITARVLSHPRAVLATTVVSIEEQLTGWYSQVRQSRDVDRQARAYSGLLSVINDAANMKVLPFTREALVRAAELRKSYPRLGRQDLAIAAIVLDHGAVLVTRNRQDFEQIEGLTIEDWSV